MSQLERMISMAREETRAAQALWSSGGNHACASRATGKKPGPERTFDWDHAARMRAEGLTLKEIGERFGVTKSAICKALRIMSASA